MLISTSSCSGGIDCGRLEAERRGRDDQLPVGVDQAQLHRVHGVGVGGAEAEAADHVEDRPRGDLGDAEHVDAATEHVELAVGRHRGVVGEERECHVHRRNSATRTTPPVESTGNQRTRSENGGSRRRRRPPPPPPPPPGAARVHCWYGESEGWGRREQRELEVEPWVTSEVSSTGRSSVRVIGICFAPQPGERTRAQLVRLRQGRPRGDGHRRSGPRSTSPRCSPAPRHWPASRWSAAGTTRRPRPPSRAPRRTATSSPSEAPRPAGPRAGGRGAPRGAATSRRSRRAHGASVPRARSRPAPRRSGRVRRPGG